MVEAVAQKPETNLVSQSCQDKVSVLPVRSIEFQSIWSNDVEVYCLYVVRYSNMTGLSIQLVI